MTKYRILVASYTSNITTLEFDPDERTLKELVQSPAGENPSWIAIHPTDKSLIFATNEVKDGKVLLFKLQEDGALKLLESVGSAGEEPAHLAVLEDEVVVANYASGTVFAISFSTTVPHFRLSKSPIQFSGSGPNAQRQASSHPHQVFVLSSNELLIPDLGADRVIRLNKNKVGEWVEIGDVKPNPGEGPRHVQVHDGILYVLEELTGKLDAYPFPPSPSDSLIASLTILPDPSIPPALVSYPNQTWPAELLLTTSPTPVLFATNRFENHPEGDSIAVFSPLKGLSGADEFKMISSTRTGLKQIRGAELGGPGDKYLIVGGATEGGVKIYERSGDKGEKLTLVVSMTGILAPTGFIWV